MGISFRLPGQLDTICADSADYVDDGECENSDIGIIGENCPECGGPLITIFAIDDEDFEILTLAKTKELLIQHIENCKETLAKIDELIKP